MLFEEAMLETCKLWKCVDVVRVKMAAVPEAVDEGISDRPVTHSVPAKTAT